MSGSSFVGGVTQLLDYLGRSQTVYHDCYHQAEKGPENTYSCQYQAPSERIIELSCEGKSISSKSPYWDQAPFNNVMDAYGEKPGVGFVTGLGRFAVGVIEIGVGLIGELACIVHIAVASFFYNRMNPEYLDSVETLLGFGRDNFWSGLKETFSFGCHKIIADKLKNSDTFNSLKEKVYELWDDIAGSEA